MHSRAADPCSTGAAWPLVAVDIGNSRIKFGLFRQPHGEALPEPAATLELSARDWEAATVASWLAEHSVDRATWKIASVFRAASGRLADWIASTRSGDRQAQLVGADLPLKVTVERPERVGVDRLLGAVAANFLREPGRGAIVVDLGSAITVDLVTPRGEFAGGAILPGIAMASRALHEQTDTLPDVGMSQLSDPLPPLGTSTVRAIEAGLYWGAVGAVRELAGRLAQGLDHPAHLFLTGGAAPTVAQLLGEQARFLPHLVLAGIALCHEAEG